MSYSAYTGPDPDAIKRRRAWATAQLEAATDASPVQSPMQAVARALQGIVGGYMSYRADQDEKTGKESANTAFSNLFKPKAPTSTTPDGSDLAAPARFDSSMLRTDKQPVPSNPTPAYPTTGMGPALPVSYPAPKSQPGSGYPWVSDTSNAPAKGDLQNVAAPAKPTITPEERDLLIRTGYGEALNEPDQGKAAVQWVIRNRLKNGGYGGNVKDVLFAKNQFEPWATRRKELMALSPNSPGYQEMGKIVDAAWNDQATDPTGGAVNFLNPDIVKQRGDKIPDWASGGDGTRIGNHVFFGGKKVAQADDGTVGDDVSTEDLLGYLNNPWISDTQSAVISKIIASRFMTPLEKREQLAKVLKAEKEALGNGDAKSEIGKIEADFKAGIISDDQRKLAVENIADRYSTPEQKQKAKIYENRVQSFREKADDARNMLTDINTLRLLRSQVGYEGIPIASKLWATVTGAAGEGSGQALESKATEMRLNFTNRTKGAISDKEMALFGESTPGIAMTDSAADSVLNAWDAANQRIVERANFLESWYSIHHDLEGADAAWDKFRNENPVIEADGKGGIKINQDNISNWERYLGGGASAPEPKASATPANTTVPKVPQDAIDAELRRRGLIQ